jgi:transposase-like protein
MDTWTTSGRERQSRGHMLCRVSCRKIVPADATLRSSCLAPKEGMSVSDLCREFGVSRPAGYRWINRYEEVGPEGLLEPEQ